MGIDHTDQPKVGLNGTIRGRYWLENGVGAAFRTMDGAAFTSRTLAQSGPCARCARRRKYDTFIIWSIQNFQIVLGLDAFAQDTWRTTANGPAGGKGL